MFLCAPYFLDSVHLFFPIPPSPPVWVPGYMHATDFSVLILKKIHTTANKLQWINLNLNLPNHKFTSSSIWTNRWLYCWFTGQCHRPAIAERHCYMCKEKVSWVDLVGLLLPAKLSYKMCIACADGSVEYWSYFWSLVAGHCLPVTVRWSLVAGHCSLITGCRSPVAGHRLPVSDCMDHWNHNDWYHPIPWSTKWCRNFLHTKVHINSMKLKG